jgi:hypothetical protein
MIGIDAFADELFEEAKRFLEKTKEPDCKEEGQKAFLYASLLLGMVSLEAYINAISIEMVERPELSILDLSILQEKEFIFKKGKFELSSKLKMYNLMDRLEYITVNFGLPGRRLDKNDESWVKLTQGISLRNSIVHSKDNHNISNKQIEDALEGILGILEAVYMIIYNKHFPARGRHLDSKMKF